MTLRDLINWAIHNDVSFDTNIALRAKDDYLLVPESIRLDNAYFGNCPHGNTVVEAIAPRDKNGDIDYDNVPHFLVLDTGRG